MAARGHYYALEERQRAKLLSLSGDDLISYIHELYGQLSDRDHQGVDKAWDAIHRCLTGDSRPDTVDSSAGSYPLNQCVLGGRSLYDGEDFIVTLIEANALRDLSQALDTIDDAWMERAYHKYCKDAWPQYGDEDCDYTLGWFEDLKIFLRRAAQANRSVVFCADQ